MCELFISWEAEIRDYCRKNDLSFEKVKSSAKCWGKNDIVLQHYDESKSTGAGLLDETPLPIVLKIKKVGNDIIFEQTKNTKKYLSI